MCHSWQRYVYRGFWWRNLRERCQWEYNSKMDLKEMDVGARSGLFWLGIRSSGRPCGHGSKPWNVGNFLASWETVSFSRSTVLCV